MNITNILKSIPAEVQNDSMHKHELIIKLYNAENFGMVLKILRESKGLSKISLANQSGIDRTVLSKLETRAIQESNHYLEKLEKVFDIPSEFLRTFARNPRQMTDKIRQRYVKSVLHICSLFVFDEELTPFEEGRVLALLI